MIEIFGGEQTANQNTMHQFPDLECIVFDDDDRIPSGIIVHSYLTMLINMLTHQYPHLECSVPITIYHCVSRPTVHCSCRTMHTSLMIADFINDIVSTLSN